MEVEIRIMLFHPANPLISLYGQIKKLQKLRETVVLWYTKHLVLAMRLSVIQKTSDFEGVLLT